MATARTIEAGRAAVRIIGDDADLQQKLRQTQTRLKNWGRAIMTVGVAVTAAFVPAIKAASDAQETMNKFNVVFADNAEAMKQWADDFAGHIGRSRNQIRGMLADTQDLLVPIGFDASAAEETSKQIAQLAIDLASFNNLADADVLRDMHAALTGSGEVMKKYGVIVNETAVQQELLNQGMDPKRVGEQEKALARFNVIMRGTAAAHGDAERSADSLANQTKRVLAQLEDIGAEIGQVILPRVEAIVGGLSSLIGRMSEFVAEHPRVVDALFNMAMAATAFGAAMQGIGFLLGPLGTMAAITGGQVAADRLRERRANRAISGRGRGTDVGTMVAAGSLPGGPRKASDSTRRAATDLNASRHAAANQLMDRQQPMVPGSPLRTNAGPARAAQIQMGQQIAAGEKLNLTLANQAQQVSRTQRAWTGLWNVLAANTALQSLRDLLGRRGLTGGLSRLGTMITRIGPALAGLGSAAIAIAAPLAAVAGKVLLLAGIVASLVYGIIQLPAAFRAAVDLLDEWGQSNAAVAAIMSGLRATIETISGAISGLGQLARGVFNMLADGATRAWDALKDAPISPLLAQLGILDSTFGSVAASARGLGADLKDLGSFTVEVVTGNTAPQREERGQQESQSRNVESAERAQEARSEIDSILQRDRLEMDRDELGADAYDQAAEAAERHVQALKDNLQALQDNGVGIEALRTRQQQLAAAEQELAQIRGRAEGIRRADAAREEAEQVARLRGEILKLNATDQERRIMQIQGETEALREQAREMGVLAEVAADIDAQEQIRIQAVIDAPVLELEDEVKQLRVQVHVEGEGALADHRRNLLLLQQEHEQAVHAARQRGIEDERYFEMLAEKYQHMETLQQRMNAARIEATERFMEQEIAHLEIEAGPLEGLDKRMAQLQVDFAEDLRRALEEGLDPDLVRKRFELLTQLAEAEFDGASDLAGPASQGTFHGRFAGLTGDKVWQDRLLEYTRLIAQNTEPSESGGTAT